MSKYDDIIDMPRHVSAVRRPMSTEARAAQFAPFAALTGHDEILSDTVRVNEREYESEPDDFRNPPEDAVCIHMMHPWMNDRWKFCIFAVK